MRKRFTFGLAWVLLVTLFFSICSATGAEETGQGKTEGPGITAEAAVLLDWNSGRVLYARNPHLSRPMASTTKIMTAIVALERGQLDDEVITSPGAAGTGGSSIWLEAGERKTLEELLFGLMLRSGNDAAVAIAEHISGSVEEFARLMTQRARELGARNTSFCNPHGLHHPAHYTTAYDLALIAAHGMGLTEFRRIIATSNTVISWPGHPWDRCLYNQNKLFTLYPGAEGIKTGWTTPAGRCFVGAAIHGGRRLVTVVLNAPQQWEDTTALLDYGFNEFQYHCLVEEGQYLKSVAVMDGVGDKVEAVAAQSFYYPLKTSGVKNTAGNEKNTVGNKSSLGNMEGVFEKYVGTRDEGVIKAVGTENNFENNAENLPGNIWNMESNEKEFTGSKRNPGGKEKNSPGSKGIVGDHEKNSADYEKTIGGNKKDFASHNESAEGNNVTYRFMLHEPLKAPLKAGERIGELEICFAGETVGLIDLLAGNDVQKIGLWEKLKRMLGRKE